MEKCFVQGFVEAELQSICNDINRQQGFQKGGSPDLPCQIIAMANLPYLTSPLAEV